MCLCLCHCFVCGGYGCGGNTQLWYDTALLLILVEHRLAWPRMPTSDMTDCNMHASIFQQFFVFFLTPLSSYSRWLRVTLSLLTADNTELQCNYWELFFLVGRRPHVATPCMSDKLAGALSVPHQCRSSYVSHPHIPLSCLINLQSKPKTLPEAQRTDPVNIRTH